MSSSERSRHSGSSWTGSSATSWLTSPVSPSSPSISILRLVMTQPRLKPSTSLMPSRWSHHRLSRLESRQVVGVLHSIDMALCPCKMQYGCFGLKAKQRSLGISINLIVDRKNAGSGGWYIVRCERVNFVGEKGNVISLLSLVRSQISDFAN